ncbi:MAG: DUF3276 family protein, partial [Bacteroidota bacterium]
YKEDFNRFMDGLQEVVDHVKTDLMPDYDYDEYTRRHEEYEAKREMEAKENGETTAPQTEATEATEAKEEASIDSEEDMSW